MKQVLSRVETSPSNIVGPRASTIDWRRLPPISCVRRQVAVIVTMGGDPSAQAAKAATATIPIVFVIGTDPIRSGLVSSLNHPGGNITGVSVLLEETEAKRLGLLRELRANTATIAVLVNPRNPLRGNPGR